MIRYIKRIEILQPRKARWHIHKLRFKKITRTSKSKTTNAST